MSATIRCPSPQCFCIFEVPKERLGRNVYCLNCAHRFTAKPFAENSSGNTKKTIDVRNQPKQDCDNLSRFPFVVILDNIRSLWNVGSIFRTADACGVQQLILTGITGTPPRSEISKTALGAEKFVSWRYEKEVALALEEVQKAGFTPIALESSNKSIPLHKFDWPLRPALLIGNEVVGVSTSLLECCEAQVSIPMWGHKDSLNVAVAFGIAAHQISTALATLESNPS